jgi:hypothetical protein
MLQDVVHIKLRKSADTVVGFHWQEVCYLGQSIDNHPNRVIPFLYMRQTHNEIYTDIIPLPRGYLQRLQQTDGSLVFCLHSLTRVTLSDVLGNVFPHPLPPELYFRSLCIFVQPGWIEYQEP